MSAEYWTIALPQALLGLANFVDDFGGNNGNAQRSFGNPFYYPSLYRQAYFIQDRWRASQSFTLSLGLRYEYFGTPMNVIPAPAFTGLFNIDPVTLTGPFGKPNQINDDKNNFSPSIGIAYAPTFRIRYSALAVRRAQDILPQRVRNRVRQLLQQHHLQCRRQRSEQSIGHFHVAFRCNQPARIARIKRATTDNCRPPLTPLLSQTGIVKDLVNPYYQRWSFTIQRELSRNWLLDLGYVGSKGTKLFATEQLNPLVPSSLRAPVPASVPASRTMARVDPLQGPRSIRTNGGSSNYNSFQAEIKRRFSNGFQFTSSYTWSKAIDNISELFNYGNTASLSLFAIPGYYGGARLDRAVSSFDRPHRWVFSYVYELPWLKQQSNLLGYVVGGWQVSGITAYESG